MRIRYIDVRYKSPVCPLQQQADLQTCHAEQHRLLPQTKVERDPSGTTIYFTRALDSTFTAGGVNRFLAAFSPLSDDLVDHLANEAVFSLTLAPDASTAAATEGTGTSAPASLVEDTSGDKLLKWYRWHGWLAVIAWAALLPSGIMFARRLCDIGPLWCASCCYCDVIIQGLGQLSLALNNRP